jgi:cell wall-associated NlpC family hydrolase
MNVLKRSGRSPLLVLCLSLVALLSFAAPVAGAETKTEAERVVSIARSQLGDNYAFAAIGPNRFDCSGLVWFVFREAGLRERIGDQRRTVAGYYKYFNKRGKADRSNPRVGDLVVWGRNKHIGIYIGDGMAISTLINPHGVKIHPVKGYLGMRFKAYLHVDLER